VNAIKDLLHTVGDHVGGAVSVRNVFGEAIQAEGRTIVPVARVHLGFGAGGGGAKEGQIGDGSGGGGGGRATPVGVVEVTAASTRLIRFHLWRPVAVAASTAFLAGFLLGWRRRRG
jgi:uncharacterized spore protein YtfJ